MSNSLHGEGRGEWFIGGNKILKLFRQIVPSGSWHLLPYSFSLSFTTDSQHAMIKTVSFWFSNQVWCYPIRVKFRFCRKTEVTENITKNSADLEKSPCFFSTTLQEILLWYIYWESLLTYPTQDSSPDTSGKTCVARYVPERLTITQWKNITFRRNPFQELTTQIVT